MAPRAVTGGKVRPSRLAPAIAFPASLSLSPPYLRLFFSSSSFPSPSLPHPCSLQIRHLRLNSCACVWLSHTPLSLLAGTNCIIHRPAGELEQSSLVRRTLVNRLIIIPILAESPTNSCLISVVCFPILPAHDYCSEASCLVYCQVVDPGPFDPTAQSSTAGFNPMRVACTSELCQ